MKKRGLLIGNFDGVHRGHQELLRTALLWSEELAVLSFDPHPLKVLQPDRAPLRLLDYSSQFEILKAWRVAQVFRLPFSLAYAQKSASDFFREEILARQPNSLVVGENFRFGQKRQAGTQELKNWCLESGIHFEAVAPVCHGDRVISSSWIRELLQKPRLTEAAELLGKNYSLSGEVIEGRQLARTLGFPTANLRLAPEMAQQLPLHHGVYWGQEKHWGPCILNVGLAPTVSKTQDLKVEVHLLSFSGSLYGQSLDVELLGFLRSEIKFSGIDELRHQIQMDLQIARKNLGVQ